MNTIKKLKDIIFEEEDFVGPYPKVIVMPVERNRRQVDTAVRIPLERKPEITPVVFGLPRKISDDHLPARFPPFEEHEKVPNRPSYSPLPFGVGIGMDEENGRDEAELMETSETERLTRKQKASRRSHQRTKKKKECMRQLKAN